MKGTNIHWIGVFLLFTSSILLLFVTLSAPIINHLGLLRIQLGNSTKAHDFNLVFGTFGYCTLNAMPNGNDVCTGRHIGYEPAALMARIDNTGFDSLSGGTSDAFTRIMILHPIACGVAFIAFLLSMGGGIIGSLAGALTAFVAWILTIIVLATDFTLFGVVRNHVNHDATDSEAYFGSAIWMLVASFMMLGLGMAILLFTCCVARREHKKNKVDTAGKETRSGRRKKRFGIF
ncbi:related to palI protein [Ramularia collo-cygni]|uniref:Related to palI protein n=1 Tax=Ramularia collo-cygni TaxID=112498 RepID=A0A2D3VC40_9PEZI|nr:related to palI protein [Ramularia collo-cygni]CZT18063.1 related to palI protein [Ramularia collo-cygni]